MKKKIILFAFALTSIFAINVNAQEKNPWTVGVDIYSSYVWRGTKLGTGPALQPTFKYNQGGFTIGGWGSIVLTAMKLLSQIFSQVMQSHSGNLHL